MNFKTFMVVLGTILLLGPDVTYHWRERVLHTPSVDVTARRERVIVVSARTQRARNRRVYRCARGRAQARTIITATAGIRQRGFYARAMSL